MQIPNQKLILIACSVSPVQCVQTLTGCSRHKDCIAMQTQQTLCEQLEQFFQRQCCSVHVHEAYIHDAAAALQRKIQQRRVVFAIT